MEPTMELDELKHAWQSLDRQLQQQKRINLQLLADNRIAGAKRGLRWLQARSVMQVAIGVVLTVFFARFWTSHLGNLPLVLSGITLHAYSVALIISGVTELLLVIRTDYAAQVVTIQKYVTLLRQWRVRSRLWFGLAQWLLWVPVMLVLLAWLAGFDLWAHSPATVLGCLAVGVAGLLATLWLIHWSPASVRRRVGNYFDDQSTGAVLRRVQDSLDEIDRFERE
ncbi:MAG TPA: hypothetical protein VIR05_07440 [Luteimonas sp.]